jgi:hypothetical protein
MGKVLNIDNFDFHRRMLLADFITGLEGHRRLEPAP